MPEEAKPADPTAATADDAKSATVVPSTAPSKPFPTLVKKKPDSSGAAHSSSTDTSSSSDAPSHHSAAFIIKAIFFITLHLAATFLLANTGQRVGAEYLGVMLARPEAIGLAVAMLIGLSAYIVTTALVSILLRPMWMVFATMFLSALMFLLLSGTSLTMIVMSFLIFAVTSTYAVTVNRKLEMQIQFSTYPLTTSNMLLIVIMGILFSTCFAQGYMNDAATRRFVVPNEYKDTLVKMTYDSMTAIFDKNPALGTAEMSAMQDRTKQETFNLYKDLEAKILPYRDFIPAFLGVSFFFLIQTPALLTSWVPLVLLALIFGFLKLTKITKEVTETREISHIEL